jgi:hypothetical protein
MKIKILCEFLTASVSIRWYNVIVVDGLLLPAMFVIAPEEGKAGQCLTAVYDFLTAQDIQEEWEAIEFQGKIILGRKVS